MNIWKPIDNKNSVARSSRHRNIVSIDDVKVKLIHKTTKQEFYPVYINLFGKIYYFTEDDGIIFIREDKINTYKIKEDEL